MLKSDGDFFPDIFDFINSRHQIGIDKPELSILAKKLEPLGFDEEISEILIVTFFEEIRNALLSGRTVIIRNLGSFYIYKPLKGKPLSAIPKLGPRFTPSKSFRKMLNE